MKAAILLARGAADLGAATGLLDDAGDRLRPALSKLEGNMAGTGSRHNRT